MQEEKDEIKIPINDEDSNFNSFLSPENNSKIFFSGKFGIGKTYFLKEFFNSHKNGYEVFHLYPVNYQINSNEDIFELIKYDILISLLKKNPEIFKENEVVGIKDSALLFYSWVKDRISINSSLQSILSTGESFQIPILSKLGRPLKDLLDVDKEFQNFKKDYKKGEKKIVEDFLSKMEEKNISETDFFSQFLKDKIELQKGDKKSVLVLDDLDRIDPEHIFRILNILSAYFEKEDENKFGFDKIIIVSDYDNLRSVFDHKYGVDTDFSGYLDKFYSVHPYYFDNKKAVISMIAVIVKSIKNEEDNLNNAIGESGYIKLFLEHMFTKFIDNDLASLRVLLKATRFQLKELKKGVYDKNHSYESFQKIFDIAIKIIITCFSREKDLIDKINIVKNNINSNIKPRMPFAKYIATMLEALNMMPENETAVKNWNGYKIVKKANNYFLTDDGRDESLFFDLLIVYIARKKYIKNGDYEYEK